MQTLKEIDFEIVERVTAYKWFDALRNSHGSIPQIEYSVSLPESTRLRQIWISWFKEDEGIGISVPDPESKKPEVEARFYLVRKITNHVPVADS